MKLEYCGGHSAPIVYYGFAAGCILQPGHAGGCYAPFCGPHRHGRMSIGSVRHFRKCHRRERVIALAWARKRTQST